MLKKSGNVMCLINGWQRPAKTEEWAYECFLAKFTENKFIQLFCFPWATLIDLVRKGKTTAAKEFETALREAPPRTTLVRATVCQHIYAMDMIPWFKKLKITDIFWAHATNTEMMIDGINIHPFPLYPVCSPIDDDCQAKFISLNHRKYLYSFVGAYEPGLYISNSRELILNLPKRQDAYVERRSEWHYHGTVYREQIEGEILSESEVAVNYEKSLQYCYVLSESQFSMCPSGSGPNSIRLWESLEFGCIPVVLSNTLRLPGDPLLWQNAAIFVPETTEAIAEVPKRLVELSRDSSLMRRMQEAGDVLRSSFGKNGEICKYVINLLQRSLDSIIKNK